MQSHASSSSTRLQWEFHISLWHLCERDGLRYIDLWPSRSMLAEWLRRVYVYGTKFGIDSSYHFPFRVRTHRQTPPHTHKVTDSTWSPNPMSKMSVENVWKVYKKLLSLYCKGMFPCSAHLSWTELDKFHCPVYIRLDRYISCLQCFDAVGWVAGRAPGR